MGICFDRLNNIYWKLYVHIYDIYSRSKSQRYSNWNGQSPCWVADSRSATQDIPHLYGSRRFITMFTTARHWSLSSARCIQSTPSHPNSLTSILMLSSHLRPGITTGLFPSGFRRKLCMHFSLLPCDLCHKPNQSPSFDHLNTSWTVQITKTFIM
jgi:hypothetical protein